MPQIPMLATPFRWTLRIAILAPAIVLAGVALPRLVSGFALAAAFPVPFFINANDPLPRTAYEQARGALAHASRSDGQTKITQAEAAYLAGSPVEDVQSLLIPALDHAPSSARGWALLA